MFIKSRVALQDEMAAIIAAMLAPISAVDLKIKLAQGTFAPTPTSDPATFDIATFDGYADVAVAAWDTGYFVPTGAIETLPTTIAHWSPTGTTTPNTIKGYWLVGSNAHYLGGEAFPAPVPLSSPADALNLVIRWQVAPAGWTAEVIG